MKEAVRDVHDYFLLDVVKKVSRFKPTRRYSIILSSVTKLTKSFKYNLLILATNSAF